MMRAAMPDARAAVLAANDEFYRAFRDRDHEAMDRLWSEITDVACVHPGSKVLIGREAVLDSLHAILRNPETPVILFRHPVAHLLGRSAFVVGIEVVSDSVLAVTNLFVLEEDGWRMVHHHASLIADSMATEEEDSVN